MDIRQLYITAVDQMKQVERKGKTMPYTSINGHMFSFISKENEVGIRLSNEDREDFLATHQDAIMMQHGRLMKEYVKVPHSLLADKDALLKLLEKSHQYVSQLKPKK